MNEISTKRKHECPLCRTLFLSWSKFFMHIEIDHGIDACDFYERFIKRRPLCACGCGGWTTFDKKKCKFMSYIHGHNGRGFTKEISEGAARRSAKMKEHFASGRMITSFQKMSNEQLKNVHLKRSLTMKEKVRNGTYESPSSHMTYKQRSEAGKKSAKTILKRYGSFNGGWKKIKRGFYDSLKAGPHVRFDSGHERSLMEKFDLSSNIASWRRLKESIRYIDPSTNKERNYYPDFEVTTTSKNVYIVEAKGSMDVRTEAKHGAAQKIFDKFIVIFSNKDLNEQLSQIV